MASSYMMKLGSYTFSINTAAYQSLQHSKQYRWKSQDRVGRIPAQQFTGEGEETITLEGVVYPHFKGGTGQLNAMRLEAGKGEPLMLVDGTGAIWQTWCIKQIDETQRELYSDSTPRKIEFNLQLIRYGDDQ
ncbi:MAG: phage tail protein [Methyloprofundus sp.]|nr:phage tail protein [Methyloprofundus sp.]